MSFLGHNYGICRKCNKEHIHGCRDKHINKGKKHTFEQNNRTSLSVKRAMWKPEIREKFLKGIKSRIINHKKDCMCCSCKSKRGESVSWSKGLTKETDERLLKLSKSVSNFRKGRFLGVNNPFYGKKHTLKTRKIIGSYHWLGGKSVSAGYYGIEFADKELRNKVKQRDTYICVECGVSNLEGKLRIHHIDYNKFNNIEDNLITLCIRCHSKTNFKREDWMRHFQNLLNKNDFLVKEVI